MNRLCSLGHASFDRVDQSHAAKGKLERVHLKSFWDFFRFTIFCLHWLGSLGVYLIHRKKANMRKLEEVAQANGTLQLQ